VKHAGTEALDRLESTLVRIRKLPNLQEKTRGVFYLRSKAFLHFHEDPAGLFADVRLFPEGEFVRMRVSTGAERARLMEAIKNVCSAPR
jgi:hypothetical protein